MFKRIGNLIKGFFGLFISKAERANPEALLEVEKENLRKMIAEYNKGLASHAGSASGWSPRCASWRRRRPS